MAKANKSVYDFQLAHSLDSAINFYLRGVGYRTLIDAENARAISGDLGLGIYQIQVMIIDFPYPAQQPGGDE